MLKEDGPLKNELKRYISELEYNILEYLRTLPFAEYRNLVLSTVAYSDRRLMVSIIHDYALMIMSKIELLKQKIEEYLHVLNRSSIKELHYDELIKTEYILAKWQLYMEPLQQYTIKSGSGILTREIELEFSNLIVKNANILHTHHALEVVILSLELRYIIYPDVQAYKNERKDIGDDLEHLSEFREEQSFIDAKIKKQAAQKTWGDKQARLNDESFSLYEFELKEEEEKRRQKEEEEKRRQKEEEEKRRQREEEEKRRQKEEEEKRRQREEEEKRQIQLNRFREMQLQAWEEEQNRYDETARQRAKEAEQQHKIYIEKARARKVKEQQRASEWTSGQQFYKQKSKETKDQKQYRVKGRKKWTILLFWIAFGLIAASIIYFYLF